MFRGFELPAFGGIKRTRVGRESPVNKPMRARYPMIFEGEQAGIVLFGASEIKLTRPAGFCGGNGIPEEPRGGAKPVKASVGTAVLVVDDVFEAQGKDGGDRIFAMAGETNFESVALGLNQVAKPGERLWGDLVTAAGHD